MTTEMGTQLIYFTAAWCAPCKVYGPRLTKAAADLGLTLVKIDVDEHQDMIAEFDILSVPTVIVMADGAPGERFVGARRDDELRTALSKYVV